MKNNKKIITIEEFFRLKQMFSGSIEDKELAFHLWDNQYTDRNILDPLMAKGLMFTDRKNFESIVKVDFISKSGKTLYTFLSEQQANDIYKQILDKLMND
tara:strand:- start:136 stop:435 length:300 start_codon:yes stop_codon:yes gene_type:complete